MRISAAFPSEFLKAADLQGKTVSVKISHVEMREVGGEAKPVLFFVGKEKGMVLNKTNAGVIASVYGDDTDDWGDGEVSLFEAMVDFQGKTAPALRIRIPPRKPVRDVQAPVVVPIAAMRRADDDDNDNIPF